MTNSTQQPANQQRFDEVYTFLHEHRALWEEEVLTRYPQSLDAFPEDWIEVLARLSLEELFALERHRSYKLVDSPSLLDFFERSDQLATINHIRLPEEPAFPAEAFQGVSAKKQHEILRLAAALETVIASGSVSSISDYGGGIGYLAQALGHLYALPIRSLDRDQALQEKGRHRQAGLRSVRAASVRYVHCDLTDAIPDEPKGSLCLGLHTCGSLAPLLLQAALEQQHACLLNFGCCYYKTEPRHLHLSERAKGRRLNLTAPALTLASRSHKESKDAFLLSKRVKRFRYTLHLFLYHELGQKHFVSVGNSPRELYRGDFAPYAVEQLQRLGFPAPDKRTLEQFFSTRAIEQQVWRMTIANIIRFQAGRLLELYVLFDRALLLEEAGLRVTVAEYFDQRISPRNVGISAERG
ncbi:MAG: methyltransferase [Bdellovibrionales bacterium]|nr:methyltransferase [Bdellovibrionales bacterium]